MNFNKININFISLIISILIFILIVFLLPTRTPIKKLSQNIDIHFENLKKIIKNNTTKKDSKENNEKNNVNNPNELEESKQLIVPNTWKIIIPKLNLDANIKQGINNEIINYNVGHYEKSNILNGKIILFAYNYGENHKNYFANLKELKTTENLVYVVDKQPMLYKVISNIIIPNDEKYINEINYDCLILLTYVIDMPNAKRCVIAIR